MLSTHLLAFGITHLTDARYFAAWEADYLCFPLGEGGLSLDYFLAIREWVEGPVCVVELGADAGAVFPAERLRESGVTHVLLSFGTDPAPYLAAGIAVLTRIPVAGYHSADDLRERMEESRGTVLLDFTDGGIAYTDLTEDSPFSIGALQAALGEREVYLRLDLDPEDAEVFAALFPGLALRGSSEEKVGYKNFDDIDELLEALE